MTRTLLALILASAAYGAQPAFEVASVRPANAGDRRGLEIVPGAVTMRNYPLSAIIRWAYDINEIELSGPGWMNDVAFDIAAKAGAPAREADLRGMMRTLLAERFRLETHRQSKEAPALILTVAKSGHKLKEVQEEGKPSFQTGKLNLTGRGATIAQLTKFLSAQLRQPVVDQTGLTGRYDYFMDINQYMMAMPEEQRNQPNGGPPAEGATIVAQALQAQLGLRVDPKKSTLEILVVDKIERAPTDN